MIDLGTVARPLLRHASAHVASILFGVAALAAGAVDLWTVNRLGTAVDGSLITLGLAALGVKATTGGPPFGNAPEPVVPVAPLPVAPPPFPVGVPPAVVAPPASAPVDPAALAPPSPGA